MHKKRAIFGPFLLVRYVNFRITENSYFLVNFVLFR